MRRGAPGVGSGGVTEDWEKGDEDEGGIKGWNTIYIVSYRPAELHTCNSNENGHSRVVNEELVAVFLDAEALAGDFGTVDGHQVRNPRLEPPTVPFLRERAA